MSAISIAIKAVDQYSGVLTGLNQGFELVGKAIRGVRAAADLAFSAIQGGVELARIGGAFQEQRNQFENLAKSYRLNGQDIIDTVKRTSANTITEFDSIAIATRGVAAGLQGQDLDNALTYVKRWSEATGESFQSAAERIFVSLSSGRYSVLRQMGLVIENGADLNDVTEALSKGLERFGDTGFNAADKLDALNASQEDFSRKLGQGINNSLKFQEVLGGISDGFVEIINSFDPVIITYFVDQVVGGALAMYQSFRLTFPQIAEILDRFFTSAQDDSQGFSKAIVVLFFDIARAAGNVVNSIIDSFQVLNEGDILSGFVQTILGSITTVGAGFSRLISGVLNAIGDTFNLLDSQVASLEQKLGPTISDAFGIGNFRTPEFVKDLQDSLLLVSDSLTIGFDDLTAGSISGLDNFNRTLEGTKINIDDINAAQDSTLAGIEEVAEQYKKAQADVKGVGAEVDNINQLAKLQLGLSAEDETLDALNTIKQATSKDLKISGKLSVQDERARSLADYILEKVGAVNWPQAMQQMMDALLTMLIASAAEEPVPIAITNFTPA